MAIPLRKFVEDRSLLDALGVAQQECCVCGILLQETITGKRKTPDGEACSDCYYEKLGAVVEDSPITFGRLRRG